VNACRKRMVGILQRDGCGIRRNWRGRLLKTTRLDAISGALLTGWIGVCDGLAERWWRAGAFAVCAPLLGITLLRRSVVVRISRDGGGVKKLVTMTYYGPASELVVSRTRRGRIAALDGKMMNKS